MIQWCLSLLVVLGFGIAAEAAEITACGDVAPRGEVSVLQNDLTCDDSVRHCRDFPRVVCTQQSDCPNKLGCIVWGIFVEPGATLDLKGHSVTYTGPYATVGCWGGTCTIRNGAVACGAGSVNGSGVLGGRITLENLEIRGCPGNAAFANTILATSVHVHHNGDGLYGALHLRATDVTASDNLGNGLVGGTSLRIRGARAERNGRSGAYSRRYDIDSFESHGNRAAGFTSAHFGGIGGRGVIRNSNISGNAYESQPMDILSSAPPRVRNVACEWSAKWLDFTGPVGPGLGICVQQ